MNIITKLLRRSTTQYHNTNPKATSNTRNSTEKTNKADFGIEQQKTDQTVTNEEIPNTPFRLIQVQEKGWFATLGPHRITNILPTKNQTLKAIQTPDWQTTINVIVTVAQQVHDMNAQIK